MPKYGVLIEKKWKGKPYFCGVGGPFEKLSKCFEEHKEHPETHTHKPLIIAKFNHEWDNGIAQNSVCVLFRLNNNRWEMNRNG